MSRIQLQLCEALRQHLSGSPVPVPAGGHLVWGWFLDLSRTRGRGMVPAAITYGEIDAYARVYQWPLEPRHVDMIVAMDRVWMTFATPVEKSLGGAGGSVSGHDQPVTAAAFDAVFG